MTNPLRPGESRRAHGFLADTLPPTPAPGGQTVTSVIAVHEVCPPGDVYTSAAFDSLLLFLTLHGRAELQVGSGTFAHQPGTLIAVPTGNFITERVGLAQPWHVCYFLMSGPWADQMDAWLQRREPSVLVCASLPPLRQRAWREMADLVLTQPDGWPWPFLSRCADVFGALYSDAQAASLGDALASKVAQCVDAAPNEPLTAPEIAARLGLTPRQFIYQFQKATGEPPAQWIRKRRITMARRLLDQGQSVTSVADQLGYANPYHFSRAFKAVMGVAPSAVCEAARHARLHRA